MGIWSDKFGLMTQEELILLTQYRFLPYLLNLFMFVGLCTEQVV